MSLEIQAPVNVADVLAARTGKTSWNARVLMESVVKVLKEMTFRLFILILTFSLTACWYPFCIVSFYHRSNKNYENEQWKCARENQMCNKQSADRKGNWVFMYHSFPSSPCSCLSFVSPFLLFLPFFYFFLSIISSFLLFLLSFIPPFLSFFPFVHFPLSFVSLFSLFLPFLCLSLSFVCPFPLLVPFLC